MRAYSPLIAHLIRISYRSSYQQSVALPYPLQIGEKCLFRPAVALVGMPGNRYSYA